MKMVMTVRWNYQTCHVHMSKAHFNIQIGLNLAFIGLYIASTEWAKSRYTVINYILYTYF